jgi:fido (protein-threonine AMPylation protein)/ribosomal protein S25
MSEDLEQYYEATEPGRRERAYAWATAIGLQDVDGLKPSKYLLATAKRHIEGEISQADARRLVDEYYETKEAHDLPDDVKEADKVAARMIGIIGSPTFNFSVAYYLGLHRQIFDGVFKFAGEIRSVELTKHEWVLKGDTVQYTPSCMIMDTLEYDFAREGKFKYTGLSEDAFVEHFASFISGIWQIHPFREGNTRTAGLFAIKYLRSKGFDVTNDLFAEKSYYFRNALVRANYENTQLGIEKTPLPLEDFFKVLIYGYDIELKNRFLRIGCEYGSVTAEATKDLHRHDKSKSTMKSTMEDDDESTMKNGGEGTTRLNATDTKIVNIIKECGFVTIPAIAQRIGLTKDGAFKALKRLKASNRIRRVGPDKGGHWEVC